MGRQTGHRSTNLIKDDRSNPDIVKISLNTSKSTVKFSEFAGRTTAECVAICCCFPCGILNLLIFAAVRLPVGLCRRVIRKRILLRRSKMAGVIGTGNGSNGSVKAGWSAGNGGDLVDFGGMKVAMVVGDSLPARSPAAEVVEMEEEVWSKIYNSGFWRTPSQREIGEGIS